MKDQKTVERYPFFTFRVTGAGKLYTPEWELSKRTVMVKGVQLSGSYYDKLFLRGSQRIEIGGVEIVPEGFASRIFLSEGGVAPRERYFPFNLVHMGDYSVKLRFQDTDHPLAPIGDGYDVFITFITDEKA